jgi:hypothetical protein
MKVAGWIQTPIPEGLYRAVCTAIEDLGPRPTHFGTKKMLRITWQLADLIIDGVKPTISRTYNQSLHEKSALHRDLKAWRGQAFTPEELRGFELDTLINVPCRLMVQQQERDGHMYSNIAAVMKPEPAAAPANPGALQPGQPRGTPVANEAGLSAAGGVS